MDQLLTVKKVAELLATGEKTVYREIWAERLRASKVRGLLRVMPEDLELYVRKQVVQRENRETKPRRSKPQDKLAAHEASMSRLRKMGLVK